MQQHWQNFKDQIKVLLLAGLAGPTSSLCCCLREQEHLNSSLRQKSQQEQAGTLVLPKASTFLPDANWQMEGKKEINNYTKEKEGYETAGRQGSKGGEEVERGNNRHQRSLVVSWGFCQQQKCYLPSSDSPAFLFVPFYLFLALLLEFDCSTMSQLVLKDFSEICHPTRFLKVKQDADKQDRKGPIRESDRRPEAIRPGRGQSTNWGKTLKSKKCFKDDFWWNYGWEYEWKLRRKWQKTPCFSAKNKNFSND